MGKIDELDYYYSTGIGLWCNKNNLDETMVRIDLLIDNSFMPPKCENISKTIPIQEWLENWQDILAKLNYSAKDIRYTLIDYNALVKENNLPQKYLIGVDD